MELLAAALALVCAYSQPLCDARQGVTIVQGPTVDSHAGQYAPQSRRVTINDRFNDPGVVSTLLAHELTHVVTYRPDLDCVQQELQAYIAQGGMQAWLDMTFGRRVNTVGLLYADAIVWTRNLQDPLRNAQNGCGIWL